MTTLLIIAGLVALTVVLAYTLFAPWWSTRSGRAVFALYWSYMLILGHFTMEAIWGQNPKWVEYALLILVILTMAWNGYTIISKQVLARRNHEEGH